MTLKRLDLQSSEWARLENSKQSTVAEFIDLLDEQAGSVTYVLLGCADSFLFEHYF